jgi:dTDP-4-amino-4,6-dideoxygalactose transaminase
MTIPFSPPYIDEHVEAEVLDSLRSGWITTGPKVRALEEETARLAGVEKALGCNSATSALMLVLHWYGVGRGDEVIVPAYTYCATALAVMHVGATPVMVDVGEDFNMDMVKVRAAITPRTKAIIPVDIAGWPCDYAALRAILAEEEVKAKFAPRGKMQEQLGRPLLLADAAHSIGSRYDGHPAARQSDITVYSFHAVKNVTTAEGGVICLNLPAPFDNAGIYATLRLWSLNGQTKDAFTKSQGGSWRYDIVYPGFKMNMPDICAAIGLAQIRQYEDHLLPARRRIFARYGELFAPHPWAQLPPLEEARRLSSAHLYPLRIRGISEARRDAIIDRMSAAGIAVNVHFIPLPMLTVFRERGYDIADFPVAYDNYSREISLPIYPQLSDEQVERVAGVLVESVGR